MPPCLLSPQMLLHSIADEVRSCLHVFIASDASATEADIRKPSGGTAYDTLTTLPREQGKLSTGAHQPESNKRTGT